MEINHKFQFGKFLKPSYYYKECFGTDEVDIDAIVKANSFINECYENYKHEWNPRMITYLVNYAKFTKESTHTHTMNHEGWYIRNKDDLDVEWAELCKNPLAIKMLPDHEELQSARADSYFEWGYDHDLEYVDEPYTEYEYNIPLYYSEINLGSIPWRQIDFNNVFANNTNIKKIDSDLDVIDSYKQDSMGFLAFDDFHLLNDVECIERILEQYSYGEDDEDELLKHSNNLEDLIDYVEDYEKSYFYGSYFAIATNICMLDYDYKKIKQTNSKINEEIIMELMSPKRIMKFIERGGEMEAYLN